MTETLSIRIDAETKKRLDALSKRSKRSKSFLAAEAIAAYVESEEWTSESTSRGTLTRTQRSAQNASSKLSISFKPTRKSAGLAASSEPASLS